MNEFDTYTFDTRFSLYFLYKKYIYIYYIFFLPRTIIGIYLSEVSKTLISSDLAFDTVKSKCQISVSVKRKVVAMLERDIVRKIMNYLKERGDCFCFKEHGGQYGTAGIPDIICCCNGRFYGFEVKTEKGKPTKLQEVIIRKINEAGGKAGVVRSVEDVEKMIEEK